jgi:hypothetical protein
MQLRSVLLVVSAHDHVPGSQASRLRLGFRLELRLGNIVLNKKVNARFLLSDQEPVQWDNCGELDFPEVITPLSDLILDRRRFVCLMTYTV